MTFLINVNKFRFNLHKHDNIVLCPFSIYFKNLFIIFLREIVKNIRYMLTIFKFHYMFYTNLFHLLNIVIYLTTVLYRIEISTFFVQFQFVNFT